MQLTPREVLKASIVYFTVQAVHQLPTVHRGQTQAGKVVLGSREEGRGGGGHTGKQGGTEAAEHPASAGEQHYRGWAHLADEVGVAQRGGVGTNLVQIAILRVVSPHRVLLHHFVRLLLMHTLLVLLHLCSIVFLHTLLVLLHLCSIVFLHTLIVLLH